LKRPCREPVRIVASQKSKPKMAASRGAQNAKSCSIARKNVSYNIGELDTRLIALVDSRRREELPLWTNHKLVDTFRGGVLCNLQVPLILCGASALLCCCSGSTPVGCKGRRSKAMGLELLQLGWRHRLKPGEMAFLYKWISGFADPVSYILA
jgi:hypothetical protein